MVGFAVIAGLVGVGLVAGFGAMEGSLYDLVSALAEALGVAI